ncbi:putative intracellular septation protein A [Nitrosomonadaceae bacterium]|jgi:intracellular septation protein|nr:septation protein A [Nitrosospira sp.]MDW7642811.1 septation protein A [Nitrosomonadaceae bacterium]MBI0416167.1 septation protein A [Nitrosospira sp.]MBI0416533.1 septation protein A [Nitrosospira sp.]MBI0418589.1 septation protein A [Nitrosospira sp.]
MKFLFDLFPVVLFFIAFKLFDIYVATAVTIVATFVQIGWAWFYYHKVETMLWISLVIIVIFGSATLILQDESFIKWKPTVLYWIFTCALLISHAIFKKNLIRSIMEKQITLPEKLWGTLNLSWAIFFALMGAINLYVASHYTTEIWVNFKLFGSTGIMLLFIVLQGLVLSKFMTTNKDQNI